MTTKTEILKLIRLKCLDCCVDQVREVKLCASIDCELHKFRFGKDPDPSRKGSLTNLTPQKTGEVSS